MYRSLDERQFALLDRVGETYERCAKTKEWKMIIGVDLEERWQHVH
jgi:hypothetical protein